MNQMLSNVSYVTSVRKNSTSGDNVHIRNILANSNMDYLNLRFLSLYIKLFSARKNQMIIRESIDLLIFCLLFPNFLLKKAFSNTYVEVNGSILDESKKWWWLQGAQKKLFLNIKKVFIVSNGLKKRMIDLHGISNKKFIVINNGGARLVASDTKFKQKIKFTYQKSLKIVFIGAKTKWQDIEFSIRKLKKISKKTTSKIEVIIAGPGFEKEKEISTNGLYIRFHGKQNPDEVLNLYQQSMIVLCPDNRVYQKHLLSSPIKVYEGLCLGKLILFTHEWDFKTDFSSLALDSFVSWDDLSCNERISKLYKNAQNNKTKMRTWNTVVSELEQNLSNV